MHVVHPASGRRATYGELAAEAAALTPPEQVTLKDPAQFRLIGQSVKRLDTRAKSTGGAHYGIDVRLPGMLTAAVLHAPVVGGEPQEIGNEAALRAMPGVHSVHRLPGAIAVVAEGFWPARQAVQAAEVSWSAGTAPRFSSADGLAALKARNDEAGAPAETHGDAPAALRAAARRLEAEYDVPFLSHATMEPQNATARFNADGSLDVWVPNQAPDFYRQYAARDAGLPPERVNIHSPLLGGFFGRRFVYGQEPMTQAILLAKATGRPVKVIWTREEDFKRDHHRPQSHVKLRGGLDSQGNITALHITAVGEGPMGRHFASLLQNPNVDASVTEGLTERTYAIPSRRVDYVKQTTPANIGFWRSVGHSMNDFFYESFLDELLRAGGKDLYQGRLDLLAHSPRHTTLLRAAAELAGGWRPGVYERDGTQRAMGIALASPFGSEVATIAEVSVDQGEARVHDIWVAIDPGRVVNPAIVAAQVRSAVAIGLSQTLVEAITFADGQVEQTNFDSYAILPPSRMPLVWTAIVESGAPMGGVGEPGTPGVPGAVCNALATLTGQRVRSLPLSGTRLGRA
jgi:isoquinoline 1-oxidoreductase beta subunit